MSAKIKVSLNLKRISEMLLERKTKYITVRGLADALGISTKTAGKIMSKLADIGVVERYSRRAYRISR